MKTEQIFHSATAPASTWTNREVAMFHMYNPNGLCARKLALDAQIDALVDAGRANTGAILAYGGLSRFAVDNLEQLVNMARPRTIAVKVALDMLKRDIEQAENFVSSH